MDFTTVASLRREWYRLVGARPTDPSLKLAGEAEGEVANRFLTRGARRAQRWMLTNGYAGWRKRGGPLEFEAAVDGRGSAAELPQDFLRAWGRRRQRQSALLTAQGTRWGQEVDAEDDQYRGNFYWIEGEHIRLARLARPPHGGLYLDYHYRHPAFSHETEDGAIDFPLEARVLIPAMGAEAAADQSWLPGDETRYQRIHAALAKAKEEARDVARPTKQPREFRRPTRFGNRW